MRTMKLKTHHHSFQSQRVASEGDHGTRKTLGPGVEGCSPPKFKASDTPAPSSPIVSWATALWDEGIKAGTSCSAEEDPFLGRLKETLHIWPVLLSPPPFYVLHHKRKAWPHTAWTKLRKQLWQLVLRNAQIFTSLPLFFFLTESRIL